MILPFRQHRYPKHPPVSIQFTGLARTTRIVPNLKDTVAQSHPRKSLEEPCHGGKAVVRPRRVVVPMKIQRVICRYFAQKIAPISQKEFV